MHRIFPLVSRLGAAPVAAGQLSKGARLLAASTAKLSDSASPNVAKFYSKNDLRDFMAVFTDLVRDLSFHETYQDIPAASKHLSKAIQYNVPGGKKKRGMSVVVSYKLLAPPEEQTEEHTTEARIMGWCVEFLEASLLVSEDIIDSAEMRRGQPSWHKKEDVGLSAVNDVLLFESCVYSILHKYFKDKPYYVDILNEFHQTTALTTMGQSLDLITARPKDGNGRIDVDKFNMKLYSAIAKYKSSYFTFCLPVSLGMRLAGITRPEMFQKAQGILLEMGKIFQIQNDYMDCFGDQKVTGKIGRDIEEGKCSWLIVVAMQRASKQQKEVLRENYGNADPESVAKVRAVYEELKLPKLFKAYEEESYNDIVERIKQIPGEGKLLPPKLFTIFLDRVFKEN